MPDACDQLGGQNVMFSPIFYSPTRSEEGRIPLLDVLRPMSVLDDGPEAARSQGLV
jgi:hypothetical protein